MVASLGGDAFGGVDHDQRDVGGFQMLARHDHRELLGHQLGLALAADSGGVDEAVGLAVALDQFIDGIARGSGDGRDDGAAGSGQRVQQRRLADVGAADDGDLDSLANGLLRRLRSRLRPASPSSASAFSFFHDLCGFLLGKTLGVEATPEHLLQQFGNAVAVSRRRWAAVP